MYDVTVYIQVYMLGVWGELVNHKAGHPSVLFSLCLFVCILRV